MTYLIWSNEHEGWWRAERMGYTPAFRNAGLYTRQEAIAICKYALPTAAHIRMISELPVRLEDILEVFKGKVVPKVVLGDSHKSPDVIQTPDDQGPDSKP